MTRKIIILLLFVEENNSFNVIALYDTQPSLELEIHEKLCFNKGQFRFKYCESPLYKTTFFFPLEVCHLTE